MLARKANGVVNGFVIEAPTAGGHNAPPRGPLQLSVKGEPIYGERDVADLGAFRALGVPFWLAGSCAEPEQIAAALRGGAAGVQIGTAFAYCEESGLDRELRERVLAMSQAGTAEVFTDPVASPTGFPFKVLQMEDTHSDAATYESTIAHLRPRIPAPCLQEGGRHARLAVPVRARRGLCTPRREGRGHAGASVSATD